MPQPDPERTNDDAAPEPGDAQGVSIPHEHAMEGTSEEHEKVDGVFVYPDTSQDAVDVSRSRSARWTGRDVKPDG